MAVIGLDGHFELLNSGFEALVGYPEAEFRRARWPSAVDRDNLVADRELLAGFAYGELDEARVDTIYVHGQARLVPIAGQLELTRDADGSPAGILLSVEASPPRSAGRPGRRSARALRRPRPPRASSGRPREV